MAMPDRAPTPGRFGERLAAELDEIEAGLRRSAPQLDASSLQIFGRIGTVATLYRSFYERFLRDTDLTHTEYQVLGILRGVGARSPTELARSVAQTTAGMTKTLDRLERGGLVERRSHASDRRRVEVVLTTRGSSRAEQLLEQELEAQRMMLANVDAAGRERLRGLLDEMISRLLEGSAAR
jgi:DNA-binding MarR family transcriptional regulator